MSLLNAAKNMSLVGCKVTYKDSMADNEPLSFYIMDFSVVQGENLVIGLDGPPFFFDTAKLLGSYKITHVAPVAWDDPLLVHASKFDDGSVRKAKTMAVANIQTALEIEETAPIEEEVDVLPPPRRRARCQTMATGAIDALTCPITRELMTEPVLAADGFTYEKSAIERWIRRSATTQRDAGNGFMPTSPKTGLQMPFTLVPNTNLKQLIDAFK